MSKAPQPQVSLASNQLAASKAEGKREGHAAGRAEGFTAGKTEGLREGAGLERTRIAAILSCPEAKGRADLANHLAFKSDIAPSDVATMLAASPVEDLRASSPFFAAMNAIANPQVGADGYVVNQNDEQRASAMAASIVEAHRRLNSAPGG
ncbi:hypothetical protein HU675_0010710 [Bradyrhizobium septentrionale]|uniref:hypothetical protein n=1 Tax=Bradyrhizobium septentrionale TaxID=1404411 RepID=UPI0015966668|nr:hypothetical protein [Bradyrhizobium septentrionale]UGY27181.1 hypothetical protein HU675_0010710 [Bradyrhizobium septentrionale]